MTLSCLITQQAFAEPTYTAWGTIRELEAGWTVDSMSVSHSASVVNPSGCSVTTYGYATSPEDSGRSLFHTMLMSAFLNRKEVALLIDGCAYNKPKVISVKMH